MRPGATFAIAAALAAAAGCGCGTVPPAAAAGVPLAHVEADPLLLLAERVDGGTRITEIDAGEMLARARALQEAGSYRAAIAEYDAVVRRFAGTSAAAEAMYRKGVCFERLDEPVAALAAFRERLAAAGDGSVAEAEIPALIHAALLEEGLGRWTEAEASYRRLIDSPALAPGDRRAARMRLAAVLLAGGDVEAARPMMDEVVAESDTEPGESVHPAPAAEARYRLGCLAADAMRAAAIDSADTRTAREQLVEKAARFSDAFKHLAAAIGSGSPYWAVAAGEAIGRIYLDVHDSLMEAPLPDGVAGDADAEEAYLAFLRARTRVLLDNAIVAWEENLLRAERTGVRSPAVEATADGIDMVRRLLDERDAARTPLDDEAERLLERMDADGGLFSAPARPPAGDAQRRKRAPPTGARKPLDKHMDGL